MCGHATATTFFFFNDTATTEIYTLSLHDALPICHRGLGGGAAVVAVRLRHHGPRPARVCPGGQVRVEQHGRACAARVDRKSTRLNSSHANISYAVFCLKKKTKHLL